jgi:hypothetical protein
MTEEKKKRQVLIPKKRENEQRLIYNQQRNLFLDKLKFIFKDRVGEAQAISSWQLFTELFGNPEHQNLYKREFLWDMTKKIINAMRKSTNFFIICHNEMWFIPQTKEEGRYYEDRLNSEIAGLKQSVIRCREYIRKKEWRQIGTEAPKTEMLK